MSGKATEVAQSGELFKEKRATGQARTAYIQNDQKTKKILMMSSSGIQEPFGLKASSTPKQEQALTVEKEYE